MTMKRMIAWILILTLLLSGCGSKNADVAGSGVNMAPGAAEEPSNGIPGETAGEEAAEVTAEETTEMTTEPTEPEIFRNPLNGEILDEPFRGRVYASTISNMQDNLPHVGVNHADVIMEMYVNMNNIVRCLALFTDIDAADAVGSTRSTRPIFKSSTSRLGLISLV